MTSKPRRLFSDYRIATLLISKRIKSVNFVSRMIGGDSSTK